MQSTVAERVGLRRSARLVGHIAQPVSFGDRAATAVGELSFLVGLFDDSRRPVFHLNSLNLTVNANDGGSAPLLSVCLPSGDRPQICSTNSMRAVQGAFTTMTAAPETWIDIRALTDGARPPSATGSDTPGPKGSLAAAEVLGEFGAQLCPAPFGFEMFRGEVILELPPLVRRHLVLAEFSLRIDTVLQWVLHQPQRTLQLQPVFIQGHDGTRPTGSSFAPLLIRANEVWRSCGIQFSARPALATETQAWRRPGTDGIRAFKSSVHTPGAVGIFIAETLDQETTGQDSVTFGAGTAAATVVIGDDKWSRNANALAHALGHVLGLGHPTCEGMLAPGGVGTVMEPQGFFASNPQKQSPENGDNATNPLLLTQTWRPPPSNGI